MTPESSSAAVNFNNWPAAKQWLSVPMDGRKWKRESWGTKSNRWYHPKPAKIPVEQSEIVAGFKLRLPAFRLVFGDEDGKGTTAGFQASDWYQARPKGWPEMGDMAGSRVAGSGSSFWVCSCVGLATSLSLFVTHAYVSSVSSLFFCFY